MVPLKPKTTTMTDDELTKLAIEKILAESKIKSIRAEQEGSSAWNAQTKVVNKKFLNNTLRANAQFNRRKEK